MTKKGKNPMSVINEFMEYYISKLDFYREAARICAQICETNMEQMGIRTIVTSRAKKPERLRNNQDKLESIAKKYQQKYQLNGKKVLLFVGRFIPEKALPKFILNISKMNRNHWKSKLYENFSILNIFKC